MTESVASSAAEGSSRRSFSPMLADVPPSSDSSGSGSETSNHKSAAAGPTVNAPGCTRCSSHLSAALLTSTSASGPRALLEAIGATASIVRDGSRLAEAVVTVPPITPPKNGNGSRVDVMVSERDTRTHKVARRGSTDTSYGKGSETFIGNIRRRLTDAASRRSVSASYSGDVDQNKTITAAAAAVAPTVTVATSAVPDQEQSLEEISAPKDDEPMSVSISCQPCSNEGPEGGARAFVRGPNPLSVVLCSNRLSTPAEVEEVLIHELTHVFDLRLRGLDLRDCHQLAYSEVRAARDAECRGSLNRFTESICVKGRAGLATTNMFPGGLGKDCVGRVMEAAMADRSPFKRCDLPDFTQWSSPK